MVIQVTSAGYNGGNFAKIMINDKQVKVEKNENNHYRGLHIVIVNPQTGKVESAQAFDTYISSEALEAFTDEIPEGRIVVAACMDECATELSLKG